MQDPGYEALGGCRLAGAVFMSAYILSNNHSLRNLYSFIRKPIVNS
jgi:hypothetical protein